MSVTVAATKSISFKGPYTGKTFQQHTQTLLGRDGFISGDAVTDNGSLITVPPSVFAQRGIVATMKVAVTTVPVPAGAEPWFLIGSIPDDTNDSGVLLSATASLGAAANAVILAFKANGRWQSAQSVDVAAAATKSSEQGVDDGIGLQAEVTAGNVTGIQVSKALVVDADGVRRDLLADPTASNGAVASLITPVRGNPTFPRHDLAVLRQREPYTAEIVHVMGCAIGDVPNELTLDTVAAPAKRPAYVSKRGGDVDEQWWAWSDGTALWIQGGPAGEAFAATNLLTAAGVIKTTWLLGQRASDSAVVLLYVDNQVLRIVSFDPATGAQIDAPVTVANTGGAITHVQAVLDRDEKAHVVFENDEATQQIYYMRCSIPAGGFGVVDIAPGVVTGSATATNDTRPSLGLNRRGEITVAYIQGSGTDEFGDLVVVTLDATGEVMSQQLIEAATDVAIDDKSLDVLAPYGIGFEPVAFVNLRHTAVALTPYDEVYVFTLGLSTGSDPNYVLMYQPELAAQLGSKLVNALPVVDPGSNFAALAALAGESGELHVLTKTVDGSLDTRFDTVVLNPQPFKNGRMGEPSILQQRNSVNDADIIGTAFSEPFMAPGPTGTVVINYVINTDVRTVDLPPLHGNALTPHPRDVVLGRWNVPAAAAATIDSTDPTFEIFNTRPKRMNFPFLVGSDGDYQGYDSLYQAGREALYKRGEIIVRTGQHYLNGGTLRLLAPLRSDGRAVLIGSSALNMGLNSTGGAVTVAGNVISGSGLAFLGAGDILDLNTSRRHVVRRALGYNPSLSKYQVVVEDNASGAPVGTTAIPFYTGLRIEGLTFVRIGNAAAAIDIANGYQSRARDLIFEGDATGGMTVRRCIAPVLDNIDFTGLDNTVSDVSLLLSDGEKALLHGLQFRDGGGQLSILATCQDPRLVGCASDGTDPTQVVYDIAGGRSTEVLMVSCTGTISGDVTTLLNPRVLIDNTTGAPDRQLMDLVGAPDQAAPLANLSGKWNAELGVQSFIDSVGDLSSLGDRFFEDFYTLEPALWAMLLTAKATCRSPAYGEQPHALPAAAWQSAASSDVTLDGVAFRGGAWSINGSGDNAAIATSLAYLRPGDTLTNVLWSWNIASGTLHVEHTLLRRNLATGAAAAIVQTDAEAITVGSPQKTSTYDHVIESGYAYWLEAYVITPQVGSPTGYSFLGGIATHTQPGLIGTQLAGHEVELSLTAVDGSDSTSQLRSRYPIGAWAEQPLLRVRAAIGDLTDAALLHTVGLGLDNNNPGVAYFLHDPGNLVGLGASNELRFVVVNDSAAITSVLTGFTPTDGQFYWFWIGWKSDTEAFWGITDDLQSAFLQSGSLAVGAGTIDPEAFITTAMVVARNVSGGSPDTTLRVDAVGYRSSSRHTA